jgi:hypothetical protein
MIESIKGRPKERNIQTLNPALVMSFKTEKMESIALLLWGKFDY